MTSSSVAPQTCHDPRQAVTSQQLAHRSAHTSTWAFNSPRPAPRHVNWHNRQLSRRFLTCQKRPPRARPSSSTTDHAHRNRRLGGSNRCRGCGNRSRLQTQAVANPERTSSAHRPVQLHPRPFNASRQHRRRSLGRRRDQCQTPLRRSPPASQSHLGRHRETLRVHWRRCPRQPTAKRSRWTTILRPEGP